MALVAQEAVRPSTTVPEHLRGVLTERQVGQAVKVFTEFDADSSGTIDMTELGYMLTALGLPADEDTLAGLFEEADEDDSGAISWDEFLDLMGKLLQGDEALLGFSNLIKKLQATPISLLLEESRQRQLSVKFRLVMPERKEESASRAGSSRGPSGAADPTHDDGRIRVDAVLTGRWPTVRNGRMEVDEGERAFRGVGATTGTAKNEAAGVVGEEYVEWYIDNMARRGVPAAKLLGALSAKGFVPAKNDIIMEYTFARRSYHEFRSAHPELPAVARGRKVHEQCAKWAVQCVELGVRPALVLRLLREEGLDEEKNPALVRRLQDPTGRALGAVVSRSQVDPVAAARRGDHEALHWFVTGGLDVNEPSGGELLLATAAHEGHIATVNVLLQHGAQVWLPDSHGRTPLLRAVGAGSVPMVELLNYYGSPVVTRDNAGSTVLHAASAAGSAPLLRWLAGFQRDRVVDLTSSPWFERRVEALYDAYVSSRLGTFARPVFHADWLWDFVQELYETSPVHVKAVVVPPTQDLLRRARVECAREEGWFARPAWADARAFAERRVREAVTRSLALLAEHTATTGAVGSAYRAARASRGETARPAHGQGPSAAMLAAVEQHLKHLRVHVRCLHSLHEERLTRQQLARVAARVFSGSLVEACNVSKRTPLHAAADPPTRSFQAHHAQTVEALVDEIGADPAARDALGQTPAQYVASRTGLRLLAPGAGQSEAKEGGVDSAAERGPGTDDRIEGEGEGEGEVGGVESAPGGTGRGDSGEDGAGAVWRGEDPQGDEPGLLLPSSAFLVRVTAPCDVFLAPAEGGTRPGSEWCCFFRDRGTGRVTADPPGTFLLWALRHGTDQEQWVHRVVESAAHPGSRPRPRSPRGPIVPETVREGEGEEEEEEEEGDAAGLTEGSESELQTTAAPRDAELSCPESAEPGGAEEAAADGEEADAWWDGDGLWGAWQRRRGQGWRAAEGVFYLHLPSLTGQWEHPSGPGDAPHAVHQERQRRARAFLGAAWDDEAVASTLPAACALPPPAERVLRAPLLRVLGSRPLRRRRRMLARAAAARERAAAAGDPGEERPRGQLAWQDGGDVYYRYVDESSGAPFFYHAQSGVTTWEPAAGALVLDPETGEEVMGAEGGDDEADESEEQGSAQAAGGEAREGPAPRSDAEPTFEEVGGEEEEGEAFAPAQLREEEETEDERAVRGEQLTHMLLEVTLTGPTDVMRGMYRLLGQPRTGDDPLRRDSDAFRRHVARFTGGGGGGGGSEDAAAGARAALWRALSGEFEVAVPPLPLQDRVRVELSTTPGALAHAVGRTRGDGLRPDAVEVARAHGLPQRAPSLWRALGALRGALHRSHAQWRLVSDGSAQWVPSASAARAYEAVDSVCRRVWCPNGCGLSLALAAWLRFRHAHLTRECPRRPVHCRRCGEATTLSDRPVHETESCPRRPVEPLPCRLGCGAEFDCGPEGRAGLEATTRDRDTHEAESCPRRWVQCNWPGCGEEMEAGVLGAHRRRAHVQDPGVHTFTVPGAHEAEVPGVETQAVVVQMWGAGGGAGRLKGGPVVPGGGGAYVEVVVRAKPGDVLVAAVGEGGAAGAFASLEIARDGPGSPAKGRRLQHGHSPGGEPGGGGSGASGSERWACGGGGGYTALWIRRRRDTWGLTEELTPEEEEAEAARRALRSGVPAPRYVLDEPELVAVAGGGGGGGGSRPGFGGQGLHVDAWGDVSAALASGLLQQPRWRGRGGTAAVRHARFSSPRGGGSAGDVGSAAGGTEARQAFLEEMAFGSESSRVSTAKSNRFDTGGFRASEAAMAVLAGPEGGEQRPQRELRQEATRGGSASVGVPGRGGERGGQAGAAWQGAHAVEFGGGGGGGAFGGGSGGSLPGVLGGGGGGSSLADHDGIVVSCSQHGGFPRPGGAQLPDGPPQAQGGRGVAGQGGLTGGAGDLQDGSPGAVRVVRQPR